MVSLFPWRFLSFLNLQLFRLEWHWLVCYCSTNWNMSLSCSLIEIPITMWARLVGKHLTPCVYILVILPLRSFWSLFLSFHYLLRCSPSNLLHFWCTRSDVKWVLLLQFCLDKRFCICFRHRFILNWTKWFFSGKRIVIRINSWLFVRYYRGFVVVDWAFLLKLRIKGEVIFHLGRSFLLLVDFYKSSLFYCA